jgi:hypothetical protein
LLFFNVLFYFCFVLFYFVFILFLFLIFVVFILVFIFMKEMSVLATNSCYILTHCQGTDRCGEVKYFAKYPVTEMPVTLPPVPTGCTLSSGHSHKVSSNWMPSFPEIQKFSPGNCPVTQSIPKAHQLPQLPSLSIITVPALSPVTHLSCQ